MHDREGEADGRNRVVSACGETLPPAGQQVDRPRRHGLRILVASVAPPGHSLPVIGVARELVRRRHDLMYWMPPGGESFLAAFGLKAIPGRWDGGPRARPASVRPESMVEAVVADLTASYVMGLREQVDEFLEVLERIGPDVVLCGATLIGLVLAAEARGIPCVSLTPTTYYPCGDDIPPPLLGVDLTADAAAIAAARAAWVEAESGAVAAVQRLRRELGLAPRGGGLLTHMTSPMRHLVPSTPLLDLRPQPVPAHVRYVGPCAVEAAELLPLAEDLLDIGRVPRPAVLITAGTAAKHDFVTEVTRSLTGLKLGIVALTWVFPPDELHDPPDVLATRFAPMSKVLPFVDAVVTNGGSGGVLASLRYGKPLVVCPGGSDQKDNAARVVAAGVGVLCSVPGGAYREAVSAVLQQAPFAERAQEIARDLSARGGATAAADEVEALAKQSPGSVGAQHEGEQEAWHQ